MEASENKGGYWNREASTAVINNLLRDVVGMEKTVCCDTGRHITKEQTMDGHRKTVEKPATLKPEQTPEIEDVLKSNMVEKSHGKVRKEAAKETPKVAGQNADQNKSKNIPTPQRLEQLIKTTEGLPSGKEAAEKCDEKGPHGPKTHGKEKGKEEKKPVEVEATMIESEGIQLAPAMEEVTLTKEDEERLGKLFS